MNKSRVEAFSDGVFAIAITLLVLTIAQPSDYRHLGHDLAKRWPSLAAFVVSFAVIGIMWLNHHSLFSSFHRIDRPLFYLNLLLLLTITFLPYPTGVLGEALARGRGTQTAAIAYAVTMAVNAWVWTALWLYASHRRRLLAASFPEEERALATLMFTIGVVFYTLAIGVAFLNAYALLALQAALALYYALDPVSRRPGRGKRRGTLLSFR
ncbi:MAG TPA: TMEM175 family protein [Streptosporangiaceae bacterium]|nr:TMEM175 family protein [Streptosporangiaceae bacterium]